MGPRAPRRREGTEDVSAERAFKKRILYRGCGMEGQRVIKRQTPSQEGGQRTAAIVKRDRVNVCESVDQEEEEGSTSSAKTMNK